MKKNIIMLSLFVLLFSLVCCGGDSTNGGELPPPVGETYLSVSPNEITIQAAGKGVNVAVTSNMDWTVSFDEDWCNCSQKSGVAGSHNILVSALPNSTASVRTAELTFTAGTVVKKCIVSQEPTITESFVPQGYSLVWQDEFDDARDANGKAALPSSDRWFYETAGPGWVNNELQTYIAGYKGTDTCATIYDGTLKIIAKKVGNDILSARINTNESWTYGYFEARLKLPKGKGTWPAYWMMPKNYTAWPEDGEIDIMEEVGYNPNYVSSSIHCKAYYHSIGTQKTAEKYIAGAQSEFHVYALEWTEDYIRTYVDGKQLFNFPNDKTGNKNTWPFDAPFYLKLNLAWGGDWGGAMGVDESALPATYEVDYVRVYQKK